MEGSSPSHACAIDARSPQCWVQTLACWEKGEWQVNGTGGYIRECVSRRLCNTVEHRATQNIEVNTYSGAIYNLVRTVTVND